MPFIRPPGIIAGGGPSGPTSFTWRGSQSTTSTTLNLPAGAGEGDFAIMQGFVSDSGGTSGTIPSGWTLISQSGAPGSTNYWYLARRVLSAADIVAGSVTLESGNIGNQGAMHCYRPDVAITSVVENNKASNYGSNPSSQTPDGSAFGTPCIIYAAIGDLNGEDFSTESPALSQKTSETRIRFGTIHYDSSGLNHTVDCGGSVGSEWLASGVLTFT